METEWKQVNSKRNQSNQQNRAHQSNQSNQQNRANQSNQSNQQNRANQSSHYSQTDNKCIMNTAYHPTNTAYYPTNTAHHPTNTAYYPTNTAHYPTNTSHYPTNTRCYVVKNGSNTVNNIVQQSNTHRVNNSFGHKGVYRGTQSIQPQFGQKLTLSVYLSQQSLEEKSRTVHMLIKSSPQYPNNILLLKEIADSGEWPKHSRSPNNKFNAFHTANWLITSNEIISSMYELFLGWYKLE